MTTSLKSFVQHDNHLPAAFRTLSYFVSVSGLFVGHFLHLRVWNIFKRVRAKESVTSRSGAVYGKS